MITYHPTCIAEGNHRFALEQEGKNVLIVIGLNPSYADESQPDPTMQSILRFINAYGYDGFVMLNLSSERSTIPTNISPTLDTNMQRKNFWTVVNIASKYPNADVLAAFGNNITVRKYLTLCLNDIWEILQGDHQCLRIGGPKGITAAGHPRHPLYSSSSAGMEPFDMDSYVAKMKEKFYGSLAKKGLSLETIAETVYAHLATKHDGLILRFDKLVDEIYGPSEQEFSHFDGWFYIYKGFYLTRRDYLAIYSKFKKILANQAEYSLQLPEGHGRYRGLPYLVSWVLRKLV